MRLRGFSGHEVGRVLRANTTQHVSCFFWPQTFFFSALGPRGFFCGLRATNLVDVDGVVSNFPFSGWIQTGGVFTPRTMGRVLIINPGSTS